MSSRCWIQLCLFHFTMTVVFSSDLAILEVVLYENNAGGFTTYNYKVQGHYVNIGPVTSAEGDISQLHGETLCLSSKEDQTKIDEYGWVGVMRLLPAGVLQRPCLTPFQMAEIAIQRGATAVIFDVSDKADAVQELESNSFKLLRPVIAIKGKEATILNKLLDKQRLARARIQFPMSKQIKQEQRSNEYFDMGIFMAFFVLVSLICLVLLVKIKWRQKRKQSSLTRMALQAISRMETRKYTSSLTLSGDHGSEHSLNTVYSCNRWPTYDIRSCAICLEEFIEGQDIRIVPCRHEFHKACVDPWLLSNCTCPLCMLNIVEPLSHKKKRSHHSFSSISARQFLRALINRRCNGQRNDGNGSTTNADASQPDFEEGARSVLDPQLEHLESNRGLPSLQRHNPFINYPETVYHGPSLASGPFSSNNTPESRPESGAVGPPITLSAAKRIPPHDCVTQHRLHKCKLHQKRVKGTNCSSPVAPSDALFERSIVVVANLPLDSLEILQEDVV